MKRFEGWRWRILNKAKEPYEKRKTPSSKTK
jgi:hypothetical protein